VVAEQARPDEKKGESTLAWPLFLPDGHHYLFVVDSTVAGKPRTMIHVGSIDEPGSKELAPTDTRVEYGSGYLVYAEQNTLVARKFDPQRLETIGDPVPLAKGVASSAPGYFSASAAGVLAYMTAGSGGNSLLTWIDREGKELGKEGPPGEYRDLALSPDGTRLAYGLSDGRQEDLWVRDLRRGVAMRLTSDPKDDAWPTWSPDGSRIWFTSNRAGVFSLMQKSSSGTGAEELLYSKEGTNLGPDDASADGRWIALGMFPLGAPPDIFVMPTQGPREPKPFLTERAVERTPAFSPDGRWVAYMSNETGKSEIYVQPFPATGAKWTVSTGGGNTPRWRGDGKELFYLGPDDTLYAVPVTLGASFDAGQPKALFRRRTEKSGIVRNRYVVTADGKRFLINGGEEDRGATPFSVVLNWPQGLAGE
jgi:dipeptidyl aminopeptidase/acylaminoacyl peptidase